MKPHGSLILIALVAMPSLAANIEAGRDRAATVCAACHGATGVSVSDDIPNLAGQRAAYLIEQLQAFKDGTRKSDIMNVIAPQLGQDDIVDVAAHFAAQQGAAAGAKSPLLPNVAKTHVTLPATFDVGFERYLTKDDAASRTVSIYYASDVACAAAKAGTALPDGSAIYLATYGAKLGADERPVVGADGHLVPAKLRGVTAMAREAGWGDDIPAMLRNENWNYAVFSGERIRKANVNQAECLACHKPKASASYLFLHDKLVAAARE